MCKAGSCPAPCRINWQERHAQAEGSNAQGVEQPQKVIAPFNPRHVHILGAVGSSTRHDVTPPNVLSLDTKSLTSPELILTDIKINDQNNKNGLIEPAEIIEATMYVRNKGQQVAKDVNIAVLYGDFVFNTGKSSFELGDIRQNQKKKVQFSFFAMSEAQKELPISFEVKESRSKFDQIIPSGLDLSRNNKNQN